MAKAFKCDICDQYYDSNTSHKQIILRNNHSISCDKFYDICPYCLESFQWWMGTRHPKHKTALAKPDSGCGWVD